MLARSQPFRLSGPGTPGESYEGLLLAPGLARNALYAPDSDLLIFDAGIGTAASRRLLASLKGAPARVLEARECQRLRRILPADHPDLDMTQADAALDALLAVFGKPPVGGSGGDPRIGEALRLIAERALDEISLPYLAHEVAVSSSRLRALFQQELGCAPMPYARWAKTWQAMRSWRPGMTFTEAAHRAGFYDLAHIDHAFKELFGLNPRALTTASGVHFVQCELPESRRPPAQAIHTSRKPSPRRK